MARPREQFIEKSKHWAGQFPEKWAEEAGALVFDQFGGEPANRGLVSWLAGLLASREGTHEKTDRFVPLALLPQEMVRAAVTADWARPWAEELRTRVFGATRAPFNSLDDARAWIRERHSQRLGDVTYDKIKEWQARFEPWLQRVQSQYDDMRQQGLRRELRFETSIGPNLEFPGVDGRADFVPALDSDLVLLAEETARMAEATGWQPAQATAFVLTGIPPLVPRVRLRTPFRHTAGPQGQGWWRREWAVLEVNADLTFEDLRRVFRALRRSGAVRKKPLRAKDAQVYFFAKERRDKVPRDSWPLILDVWNRAHPGQAYRSWQGLRAAYKRAEAKGRGAA